MKPTIYKLIFCTVFIALTISCAKDDDKGEDANNSEKGIGEFTVSGAVEGSFKGVAEFDNFLGIDRIKIYDLENNAILTLVPKEMLATGEFSIGDYGVDYNGSFDFFPDGDPDNSVMYFSENGALTITKASESETKGNFEFTASYNDGEALINVNGSFYATPGPF